jgi:Predicted Zn peptidase
VFRCRLENSDISGLFISHPVAGKCILVNYSEDMFRQRFTAAHEVAHSILDDKNKVIVSFHKWSENELVEVRANTFASHYLLPRQSLRLIPEVNDWDREKVLLWCKKLNVNSEVLAYSLREEKLIDMGTEKAIKTVKVPKIEKLDPELRNLSLKGEKRKRALLERGLTNHYVDLCIRAYDQNIISASRMAEMLLVHERELIDILGIFGVYIRYDN